MFPALGAYVGGTSSPGCSRRGSRRTGGCGSSSTSARTARSPSARPSGSSARPRRPVPAFEAAQIRCGMRAAEGAIEGVKIADDQLSLVVIGDAEPRGICGSGLVDACAELVRSPDRAVRPLRPTSSPRSSRGG